jgi:hypothetical protein
MDLLQQYLDDNKKELSDGIYNELCSLSLQAYKKQDNDFYEIIFLTTNLIRMNPNIYKNSIFSKKQILNLSKAESDAIKKELNSSPTVCNCNFILQRVYNLLNENSNTHLFVEGIDDDENEEINDLSIINDKKIVSIKLIE